MLAAQAMEIIDKYKIGIPKRILIKEYHISDSVVKRLLVNNGIIIRHTTRKHFFNELFFDKIETERQSYWFGDLLADVGIRKNGCSLMYRVAHKDRNHLQLFLNDIGAKTISVYDNYIDHTANKRKTPQSYISINSKRLVGDLIRLGCVPGKTYINYPWPPDKIVPDNLKHHMLRGYTDGDGCWTINDGQLQFSFIASYNFCVGAQKWLMSKCSSLRATKIKPRSGNVFELRYGGNLQCSQIYHLLYDNSTICLQRKKDVAGILAYPVDILNRRLYETRKFEDINLVKSVLESYKNVGYAKTVASFDIGGATLLRWSKRFSNLVV
jgi:hypothetical protein